MFVLWLLRAGLLLFFCWVFPAVYFAMAMVFSAGFFPGGVWAPSPKFAPLQLVPSSVLVPVYY